MCPAVLRVPAPHLFKPVYLGPVVVVEEVKPGIEGPSETLEVLTANNSAWMYEGLRLAQRAKPVSMEYLLHFPYKEQ